MSLHVGWCSPEPSGKEVKEDRDVRVRSFGSFPLLDAKPGLEREGFPRVEVSGIVGWRASRAAVGFAVGEKIKKML